MEYSEVLNAISTVFEMEQLMQAIAALKTAMYKTEAHVYEETFRAKVPLHLADLMRRNIPEDRDKGVEYLEGLKEAMEGMPVVTITMAFHPTEGFLAELGGSLKELMQKQVLVDIRVRRLLLGGARVEYGGRFKDYSVRHRLTEILDDQSGRIAAWGSDG